jgi:hypothetical protein
VVSKKSVVWESALENSRGIEECELEFLLRRLERGQKNYSRNSVYAKQNHCVFEAKVVCIFVAKLLCISIANWCVGKGGPLATITNLDVRELARQGVLIELAS